MLCDFGFAVHLDLQYLPAKVRGTPKFFAPELSRAAKRAGQPRATQSRTSPRGDASRLKADSFSFGALIQEVVIGEVSGPALRQARAHRGLLSAQLADL